MNLAAIPSPTTAVWNLGPIPIRAYALFIVLGIVAACAVAEVRLRRRGAPPYLVLDVAVVAVPLGIVGARLYHVITSPDSYFGRDGHPLEAFEIWKGGLGIWGGIAGGVLGAWIVCRMRGIPLSYIADAAAPGLPLAQGIGRWGNYFNNELFGRPTSLPWGLRVHIMDPDNPGHAEVMDGKPVLQEGLFHPTFLYESLWDVGVAILVWQLDKRYRFGRGRAFALYAMAYTAGRSWTEALRIDQAHHFLGLRLNDWTSIVVFLAALVYFVRVHGPQLRLVADEDGRLTAVPAGAAPAAGGGSSDGDDAASGEAVTGEAVTGEAAGGEVVAGEAAGGGSTGDGEPTGDGPDEGSGSPGEPDDAAWRADQRGDQPAAEAAPEADDLAPEGETAPTTAEK